MSTETEETTEQPRRVHGIVLCPKCGKHPTTRTEMGGNAYSAHCSGCGWNGGSVGIEATPVGALKTWSDKAENAKNQGPDAPKENV